MTLDTQAPEGTLDAGLSAVLRRTGSATGALAAAEGLVRLQPGILDFRWQLFQWLSVADDWTRALRQLQVAILDVATLTLRTGHG